jgi:hypothetical protein
LKWNKTWRGKIKIYVTTVFLFVIFFIPWKNSSFRVQVIVQWFLTLVKTQGKSLKLSKSVCNCTHHNYPMIGCTFVHYLIIKNSILCQFDTQYGRILVLQCVLILHASVWFKNNFWCWFNTHACRIHTHNWITILRVDSDVL